MKKKIAILGASYLQKPLVEKAMSLGIETHCFAWDNDQAVCKGIADFFYPISVLDKEIVLSICKQIQIDGITTIATDICMPTISYVAEELDLISNSYTTSIVSTNKAEMRAVFRNNNILSPHSETISGGNFDRYLNLSYPLIVKPTDRSGSRGITKVNDKKDLKKAIEYALIESVEKKAVIEEFIEGDEVSVECISWEGKHYILSITDKVTTNQPYFVEIEHHQPSSLHKNIQKIIEKQTLKALDSLGIKYGASHSEFKITKDGKVFVIEVGARMGGDYIGSHLVELSTGYDFLKGVIDVSLGRFTEPVKTLNKFAGIYFLSKETTYLQKYFDGDYSWLIEKNILNNELFYITNSNDRSGFIVYQNNKKIVL